MPPAGTSVICGVDEGPFAWKIDVGIVPRVKRVAVAKVGVGDEASKHKDAGKAGGSFLYKHVSCQDFQDLE